MEITYNEEKGTVKMRESYDHQNIYDYFKKKDLYFPREILTRYALSLKTKPFILLTGISGTGKTKIAQVFAEYICQDVPKEDLRRRVAFVSVRPDWMDNKGLLGYYNLLDQQYHATPVLELLLDAGENPDKPYFVILDEMNLAKVEQYFSDFLSIMESRTSANPKGESFHLHSAKAAKTPGGMDVPPSHYVPQNVFFTGTVNVDESTYMFSPKVLDRANVIEFNDVNLHDYDRGYKEKEEFTLRNPNTKDTLLPAPNEDSFCSRRDYESVKPKMQPLFQEIIDVLHPYNLHFGYRVVNEISRFIRVSRDMTENFRIECAFDIQILQKILPKFHGTQARLEEPLKKLLALCGVNEASINDATLFGTEDADMLRDCRYPRSGRKLLRMLRNLKMQGYTSFIE